MSKEKAPAFQFYPRDLLSDINWKMMNYCERGMYWELIAFCWLEGSLPADLGALARLLQIGPEQFSEAWKMIGKCFIADPCDCHKLLHPRLEIERKKQRDFSANKSLAGSIGAKKRWAKHTKPKKIIASAFSANSKTIADDSSSSSTAVYSGKSKNDLPVVTGRKDDPLYAVFREVHQEKLGAPYQYQKADFVHLDRLKKDLSITNGDLPDGWKQTCTNYLITPQSKLTLADLCSRYAIFLNSSLDKFGKPVHRPVQAELHKPKTQVTFGKDTNGDPIAFITMPKETKQ